MKILSIITARKGSKGLKNKCIRKVLGKPVFSYSIDYSQNLNKQLAGIVHTVVSSDSGTIKKYCQKHRVEFVKRSKELAADKARIEDVLYDAYQNTDGDFDYISLLYGNVATRYPEEFIKAYCFLERNKDYDCVLSMQNVEKYNPAWMYKLDKDILAVKKELGFRRQDIEQKMIHDGHTILIRVRYLLEYYKKQKRQKILYEAFGKKIKPMINDKVIIDVDTKKDLELLSAVIEYKKNRHEFRL